MRRFAWCCAPVGYMRRKKNNDENNNRRYALPVIGTLVTMTVLAALLIGSRFLDGLINERAVQSDPLYEDEEEALEYEDYARGSLTIGEVDFDYFHNFDNYLIMGTDGSGNEDGEGEDFQNGMADFLLVMSIDKTADTYTLIELNRDTLSMIPVIDRDGTFKNYQYMQLCTGHWFGGTKEMGCENQVAAVSEFLGGVEFDGYYALSMYDIGKMNKAIGGVTVTLRDDLSMDDPAMKKGATLKLTDEQAVIFLRERMKAGEGLNTERMARQHDYLTAFLEQGMDRLAKEPRYFYELFDSMESFAQTNLSGKDLSKIAKALTSNEQKGMISFEGENTTGFVLGDGILHAEYLVSDETLMKDLTEVFGLMPQEDYWEDLVYEGINYWNLQVEIDSEEYEDLYEDESDWDTEWESEWDTEWESEYGLEKGSESVGPI